MRIQITAGGIYGAEGKELAIGTILDLAERPIGWEGRFIVLGDQGENVDLIVGLAGDDNKPVLGVSGVAFVYEAKEASPGWWDVLGPDGEKVGKSMRPDDAATFNALSAEERVEFLKGEA